MPGALWVLLLLALGTAYLTATLGPDHGKPRVQLRDGRWWVTWRRRTHGPFTSMTKAQRAALQLLTNHRRTTR